MNNSGSTYTVSFYKKVPELGWTFQSFRTTDSDLKNQLKNLAKKQVDGTVRMIDAVKISKG